MSEEKGKKDNKKKIDRLVGGGKNFPIVYKEEHGKEQGKHGVRSKNVGPDRWKREQVSGGARGKG